MQQRFDITTASPERYKAMLALHSAVGASGLEATVLELIRMRISQINGCAFCIAMHVEVARKAGISDAQLHLLPAWREAPLYSDRERAALAWAEALTRLTDGDVADQVYDEVRRHFSIGEIADLGFAVAEINGWNRMMIASRTPPALA